MDLLKFLDSIGFWDMINTVILIGGSVLGLSLLLRRHKRFDDINFYITWVRNEKNRFPLVIRFEIRNLSHKVIVISAAKFKFKKMRAGSFAHGDTISGDYEIKFRYYPSGEKEEIASLLKHSDVVTCFIPIDEAYTDEELCQLSKDKEMGTLFCTLTFIESRPKVRYMKLNLTNLCLNTSANYPRDKQQI